jgi:hypothetical protein
MRVVLSAAVVLLLGHPAFAAMSRPPVKDEAKLFSPAAVNRANRLIEDVRKEYKIDLAIDTLDELPGDAAERYRDLQHRKDKANFLYKFAQDRADNEGVDGIYLLFIRNPRIVEVIGWPVRREAERVPLEEGGGLSGTKRRELRKVFTSEATSNPDDALIRLVQRFRGDVESLKEVPPSPLDTLSAAIVVGGLVGVWLLLSLLHRVRSFASAERDEPLYRPSILGGLLGVPAAFQVYDHLFDHERPPAPAATEEVPGEAASPAEPTTAAAEPPATQEPQAPPS